MGILEWKKQLFWRFGELREDSLKKEDEKVSFWLKNDRHQDHVHTLQIDTVPKHFYFAMACPHNMQNIAERIVHMLLEQYRTWKTWRQIWQKQIKSNQVNKKDDPTFSWIDKDVALSQKKNHPKTGNSEEFQHGECIQRTYYKQNFKKFVLIIKKAVELGKTSSVGRITMTFYDVYQEIWAGSPVLQVYPLDLIHQWFQRRVF